MALICDVCGKKMRGDVGEDNYLLEDVHAVIFGDTSNNADAEKDICASCYTDLLTNLKAAYDNWINKDESKN